MYKTVRSTTPIDSLPDLDDLEHGMGTQVANPPYPGATHIPSGEVERMSKFIRQPHHPPPHAGMTEGGGGGVTLIEYDTHTPRTTPIVHETFESPESGPTGGGAQPTPPPATYKQFRQGVLTTTDPVNELSCLDIAHHIAGCPICSQIYKKDRTIYIVVIVILVIICLYLVKCLLKI